MHRFVVIALIFYASGASSLIKTATTNHTVPHLFTDFFLQDYDHRVTSAQVYGSCVNESLWKFYLETNRPIDSPDHVISCQFNVTYPTDPVHDYNIADSSVVAIAEDKALLILSEGYVHNLYILRFSDCTAVPVKYNNDTSLRAFTLAFSVQSPHGSLFDVLLDMPEWNVTDKVMFRRLTIDFEGNVVGDMTKWFLFPDMTGDTVLLYSQTKGRLVALFDHKSQNEVLDKWIMKILAIDDNGSSLTIKERQVSDNSYMAVSATNDLLTACFGVNGFDSNTLTCVQLDSDGKIQLEIHGLQLADKHSMERVYNLPGGGFMLITLKFLKQLEDGLYPYEKKEPYVTKIDRTGSIVGSMKLTNLNCNDYSAIHFFKDEAKHLCFSQVCPIDHTDNQVSLQMICSDDEDYVHGQSTPNVISQAELDIF